MPFTGGFLKINFQSGGSSEIPDDTTNPLYLILSAFVSALNTSADANICLYTVFQWQEQVKRNSEDNAENPCNLTTGSRVEDLYAKPYDDHSEDEIKNKLPGKDKSNI